MPYITVGKENSANIDLYYRDIGAGKPVVLIHGWPLNGASWEKQITALIENGHRVITYDRRGFGQSSQPSSGYDYDTFAADLNTLLTKLDLKDVSLVGFSMGTGEVTRYLSTYGSARVSDATLIGVIPPFLLKTSDNPGGIDPSVFEGIKAGIKADRLAFLTQFLTNFYNYDVLKDKRISQEVFQNSWNVASGASPIGTLACVSAWVTDFRRDLPKIDVPTLIIHGDADRILPFDVTAKLLPSLIKNSQLVTIKDGPHGILATHGEEVNAALLNFFQQQSKNAANLNKKSA